MPNVYKPSLIQIRPQTSDQSARIHENVLWFQGTFTAPLTVTQLQHVQTAFDSAWSALALDYIGPQSHYIGSFVTDWSSSSGNEVDNSAFTPVAGSGGGQFPDNVAILISLHVPTRYRGGHGRVYLPSVRTFALADQNHLTASEVNTITTDFASVLSVMAARSGADGGGYQIQVYHHRTEPLKAALEFPPTFTVNTLLASQRRRLRKAPHH